MSRKFIKDISASAVQVIINQVLGLIVFLITSVYLTKDVYGDLNWSVAIVTFATTLLSLRLEQIVVKKTAAGEDSSRIMTLFLVHVLITGTGFYLLLFLLSYIFPAFFSSHTLLLIVAISQLISFFSSPFKQVANGKERFAYLAIMSLVANLVRVIALGSIIFFSSLTIHWVLIVFIISSAIELLISFFLVNNKMKIKLTRDIRFRDYTQLLGASIHQAGAAILIAGITRIDWILLGIFSSAAVTAEYSFAYRVYELSPFPLLIIAPVLLSRFSRLLASGDNKQLSNKKKEIGLLLRWEMIAATLIPLVLNICWVPLIDTLTHDKYGFVNKWTFLILSFCIPFLYANNLLWSVVFAQHRLKLIFRITLITFCIVVAGDLLLIPLYAAKGAAIVYLAATVIEYLNYLRLSGLVFIKETWQSLLVCVLSATICGFAAFYLFDTTFFRLAFSIPVYFLLMLATRQLQKNDIRYVLQSVRKKNE